MFMKLPRWLIIISGLSGLLALLLALDVLPFLRGDFGWRWPFELVEFGRLIPLLMALVVYIAGAGWLLQLRSPSLLARGGVILWAMTGVMVLTLVVVNLRSENVAAELFARTASTLTTGVHRAGASIPLDSPDWRDWPTVIETRDDLGAHVVNGPPGLPLFYSALSRLLDAIPAVSEPLYMNLLPYQCHNYNLLSDTAGEWAAAWFGVLMPLWAALAVPFLYLAARLLPGAKNFRREITLWYPLIPALLLFAGTWYTFYPAFTLASFWLLLSGIERRSPMRLILAGLVMGVALFMAYALVPVLLFFGLYTLGCWWFSRNQSTTRFNPITVGLWFGVGLALPWLIYTLWSGETPFTLLSASLNAHLELERPYLPWVFLHFWDWMLLNGFTLMLVWLAGVFLWRRRDGRMPVVGITLLLAMVILCISGTARGETGRVWLAFTPFVLLAVGETLSRFAPSRQPDDLLDNGNRRWLTLAAVNSLLLLVIAGTMDVIGTDFSAPPDPPAPESPGSILAQFTDTKGGSFSLTGWQADPVDETITLRLNWNGETRPSHPYWFGAVLVAPDGTAYDAGVWQPGQGEPIPAGSTDAPRGTYPTTCWAEDQNIGDTVRLALPADAPAGDWWVSLSAYGDPAAPDGRLTVTLPDGTEDTQIGLGPLAYNIQISTAYNTQGSVVKAPSSFVKGGVYRE